MKKIFRFINTVLIYIPIAVLAIFIVPYLLVKCLWASYSDWLDYDNLSFKEAWKLNVEKVCR